MDDKSPSHSLTGVLSVASGLPVVNSKRLKMRVRSAFRIQVRGVSRLSVTLLLPFTSSSMGSE